MREVECNTFSPLVFSTSGGMGPIATVVYKRVASLIAEKQQQVYSRTLFWHCVPQSQEPETCSTQYSMVMWTISLRNWPWGWLIDKLPFFLKLSLHLSVLLIIYFVAIAFSLVCLFLFVNVGILSLLCPVAIILSCILLLACFLVFPLCDKLWWNKFRDLAWQPTPPAELQTVLNYRDWMSNHEIHENIVSRKFGAIR